MLDDFLFWAKCISFFVPNESIEPSSWKVSSSSAPHHLHFEKASFDWFAFFLPMHSHHNGHHLHEKYLPGTLTTKWFNYTCMSLLLLLYIPFLTFLNQGSGSKTWSVGVFWKWLTRSGQGIGNNNNNNMLQLMFMNMTSPSVFGLVY